MSNPDITSQEPISSSEAPYDWEQEGADVIDITGHLADKAERWRIEQALTGLSDPIEDAPAEETDYDDAYDSYDDTEDVGVDFETLARLNGAPTARERRMRTVGKWIAGGAALAATLTLGPRLVDYLNQPTQAEIAAQENEDEIISRWKTEGGTQLRGTIQIDGNLRNTAAVLNANEYDTRGSNLYRSQVETTIENPIVLSADGATWYAFLKDPETGLTADNIAFAHEEAVVTDTSEMPQAPFAAGDTVDAHVN